MSDKIKTIQEALNLIYHVAYRQGHHDTVEGYYTDVLPIDRFTYHEEAVTDLLTDPEFAALSALDQLAPTAEVIKGDPYGTGVMFAASDEADTRYRSGMEVPGLTIDQAARLAFIQGAKWQAAKSQPPLDIPEAIKSFEFIKEIGERSVDLTRERDMGQMVKWANHGLEALIPQPK